MATNSSTHQIGLLNIVYAANILKPNFQLKDFQGDIVVSVVKNKFSVTNARTGSEVICVHALAICVQVSACKQ